jgi:ABC-type branched-subunit amino acid transport system ATPase component/ABC-type branched-subunit amino acid transport system permease subunit
MIDFSILSGPPFREAALIAALLAYSQYILLRAGVFSVSPVGFAGVGAFTFAYLNTERGTPTLVAVLIGVAVCTVLGAVLGVLVGRLRGAYQAIATLSAVMIFQRLEEIWTSVTGGPFGIAGIPIWATLNWLYVLIVVVIAGVVVYEVLPSGRKAAAIRMDEIAAASCGANVAAGGVTAMALSSAVAGLAGAATAGNRFAIDPSAFGFGLTITVLSIVIVGGYRHFHGPFIGAFVVTALPLMLSEHKIFASSAVGVATILILRFCPRGISSLVPLRSEHLARLARATTRRSKRLHAPADLIVLEQQADDRAADASLVATDLVRSYGSVRAVDGVSLTVLPGQVAGLIGPNGAGKTSVVNLLAGVSALDRGTVTVGDTRLDKMPAFRLARRGIGRTFQACRLFNELTVEENVLLAATSGRSRARRRRYSDAQCAQMAMATAGCIDLRERVAGELPYAHQRRVEIARALALEPKFVLFDEPAAGMGESEAQALADVLRRVASQGTGVLLIDHNVTWIFSVCDVVSVQALGVIIAHGTPEAVRADPAVIAAYTGRGRASDHVAG